MDTIPNYITIVLVTLCVMYSTLCGALPLQGDDVQENAGFTEPPSVNGRSLHVLCPALFTFVVRNVRVPVLNLQKWQISLLTSQCAFKSVHLTESLVSVSY